MHRLLLFSGLIALPAFGQISLTNTSFPQANDQLIMSTLLDPAIDYATTGANYNWDFSSLTPTGQRLINYKPMSQASTLAGFLFGSFAPTPYKASYFTATTDLPLDELTAGFPVTIQSISGFSRSTATAETMIGWEFTLNGTGIPVKSDTIETRYAFPLQYGNTYISNGYSHLNMNPIYDAQWTQHRHRESDVDGWGTITTPYGTFDVLRIHHRIQESDSLYISLGGTGTWVPIPVPEAHEYEWRAVEEKEAILRIKTSVVLGTETVTGVEYRADFDPTLGLKEPAITCELFPNPAADQLCVRTTIPVLGVNVMNQQGQEVNTPVSVDNHLQTMIDVSNLRAGMYYINVRTTLGTTRQLFVKE